MQAGAAIEVTVGQGVRTSKPPVRVATAIVGEPGARQSAAGGRPAPAGPEAIARPRKR